MFSNRHEIISKFTNPVYVDHPTYAGVQTFACLQKWKSLPVIELSKVKVQIIGIDYIKTSADENQKIVPPLRFQQDCYRLWYQVDGTGILQNVTRNNFGTARPGLIGIMERSERHSYLHQKGAFECFQLLFSLLPSQQAKCYWNSEIEGKFVLEGNENSYFENLIFDLLYVLASGKEYLGLATISRILEILVVPLKKGLIIIEESQFPKNKSRSLAAKAKNFMTTHYADMHHQNLLEQECNVDINYLNILFKKEYGITLYQHITNVRMEHAKFLLETTNETVADIAQKTGYPNANSFTRAFKRHSKLTPLEYRMKMRAHGGMITNNIIK